MLIEKSRTKWKQLIAANLFIRVKQLNSIPNKQGNETSKQLVYIQYEQ